VFRNYAGVCLKTDEECLKTGEEGRNLGEKGLPYMPTGEGSAINTTVIEVHRITPLTKQDGGL
jgi:hypothetical protein